MNNRHFASLPFLSYMFCFVLSLKWAATGVLTDLGLCMLNLSSNFSIYLSWDSHNNLLDWSRVIFIPKILLADPKSFMANNLPNAFFKATIFFKSWLTISKTSTQSSKMIKSPLSYFLTKTQWPVSVFLKLCSAVNESNFLYHCLGTCLRMYKHFFRFLTA